MKQGDQGASAPHQPLVLPGSGAVALAAIFLIAALYVGSTQDFGAFLLSVPLLGLTFFGALIPTMWTTRIPAQRRYAMAAWALIVLVAPSYFMSHGLSQRVRFLIWAQAHHDQMAQASRKDGIVTWWDGWGMAGQDTDSYLVVDTEDRLGSKKRAEQWTKEIGQTCGIWKTQRMWPRFYVVATYTNCPYDGVADTVVK